MLRASNSVCQTKHAAPSKNGKSKKDKKNRGVDNDVLSDVEMEIPDMPKAPEAPGTQAQNMVWVYLRFPDYIFVGYEDGSGAGVGVKFHFKHYGTGEEAKAEAAERAMHYSAHRKYQHGDIVEYVEGDTIFA